jgi:hypothetical protein
VSGSSQNEHVIAIRWPSAGTRWLVTNLASMTRLLAMMMRGGPHGRVPGRSTSSWLASSCSVFLTCRRPAARLLDKAQPTAHAPLTSHAVTYRIGAGEGPP